MSVLRFIQVTKPIISSKIIRFQVEQTNNRVALAVFMFILNILVEQTEFQCNRGSISRRYLTITLSIDINDSGQRKVIRPSSDMCSYIHGIRNSTSVHRFTFLRRYLWRILSKTECCNIVSEGILKVLLLFTISTLSNNDVIHGVPVYLKCCLLTNLMLK